VALIYLPFLSLIKFLHYFIFFSVFKCPYRQSYFILLYAFAFCVPCCDVPYGFRIKTMFGSPLPPVFVGGLMSYLFYLCLFAHSRVQHVFNIWVTWRCLIKDRNCLPLASTWVYRRFFISSCCSSYFSFLCCIFALIVFVLRLVYPMLPVSLDRPFLIAPSVSLTFIYCNIILHFLILHSYYVVFVCL
jgi:hypothetical protein